MGIPSPWVPKVGHDGGVRCERWRGRLDNGGGMANGEMATDEAWVGTVYDRRSEPATWSRLTPALAQRIKEELNSYKMEEMEVHASSRIQ